MAIITPTIVIGANTTSRFVGVYLAQTECMYTSMNGMFPTTVHMYKICNNFIE